MVAGNVPYQHLSVIIKFNQAQPDRHHGVSPTQQDIAGPVIVVRVDDKIPDCLGIVLASERLFRQYVGYKHKIRSHSFQDLTIQQGLKGRLKD